MKQNEMTSAHVPMGTVVMYALNPENLPKGWLVCDGREVPIEYQEFITTFCRSGDHKTPDLRDLFIVGAGKTYKIKDRGGFNEITLTAQQLPPHHHNLTVGWAEADGSEWKGLMRYEGKNINVSRQTDDGNCGNQPHENRPPYYALYYIIKVTP
ncbi:phage tail protein [Elizabethkingia meningoseptica]|uniref:tail fiber protein n=1 Tax=Elizabethkingia meningoseptica TaxID=238 RepID=UPI000332BDBA|nr:tail fiber protein [Elizabethkingia meningoseptica]AQX06010.1 phage tail protein [Elizabethkingia meningoseptica]AQX48056.1 phage tail protein [Elizabethkingia meningoseptica]EOR30982.1 tail collar domain-containing protein [Elizabethkingia meningoseptica ATCC 13253 = NBRC 12535]KUY23244.1 phage tail protein [Elizabethkingia meningoseptica]OPB71391.1 phage tail protein [Elizabethkingia meningoseptica]